PARWPASTSIRVKIRATLCTPPRSSWGARGVDSFAMGWGSFPAGPKTAEIYKKFIISPASRQTARRGKTFHIMEPSIPGNRDFRKRYAGWRNGRKNHKIRPGRNGKFDRLTRRRFLCIIKLANCGTRFHLAECAPQIWQ